MNGDADVREEAARALGESGEPRAVRYLIAHLGDDSVAVAVASVRALERLGERSAVMPLYDVVTNEIADPAVRRAAAEALLKFGLLRRERTGPSPMFLWLAGLTGVVVAVGAASSLGPWAILLFLAGAGALALYAMRQLGRRGAEDAYVGPHGERIDVPGAAGRPGAGGSGGDGSWFDGSGDGGGNGGGGNGGGA